MKKSEAMDFSVDGLSDRGTPLATGWAVGAAKDLAEHAVMHLEGAGLLEDDDQPFNPVSEVERPHR